METEVKCICDCEGKQDFVVLFRNRESILEEEGVTWRVATIHLLATTWAEDILNHRIDDAEKVCRLKNLITAMNEVVQATRKTR
ncbi:hypothetical protein API480_63 [Paenibacillus phage vB_PlaP_API480]|uniref:Uncharacterized protein n=1 Tax=Paenibacillus larvae subsp. larvae TaxID=147375 RepID=A0A6C0QZC9_9BACL|nr:hypothetical protein [Paenibacillus larvae]QBX06383.1 hypothetical protein API480_63 [Paenibacillus phage vB_PlaP_API480]QHZ54059.1 hypothetical protein ERICV_05075 [Paenibacillus larvae subsp. larvae]